MKKILMIERDSEQQRWYAGVILAKIAQKDLSDFIEGDINKLAESYGYVFEHTYHLDQARLLFEENHYDLITLGGKLSNGDSGNTILQELSPEQRTRTIIVTGDTNLFDQELLRGMKIAVKGGGSYFWEKLGGFAFQILSEQQ